jgi:hypothetical protein
MNIRRLVPRHRRTLKDWRLVLVARQYLKCVAFLCVETATGITPRATGFFVVYERDDQLIVYLVTAAHNIYKARAAGCDKLVARVNREDGGTPIALDIPHEAWTCSPLTDVAVVRMTDEEFLEADIYPRWSDWLATDKWIKDWHVGTGDPVIIPGLFTQIKTQQIQPILRFGRISMMPEEKIGITIVDDETVTKVDAYLVEALSRGGVSGSPVFVVCDPHDRGWVFDDSEGWWGDKQPDDDPIRLLGLVHGHYDVHTGEDSFAPQLMGDYELNSGIAVVIPAQAITALLELPEVREEREVAFAQGAEERSNRWQPNSPPLTRKDR